MNEPLPPPLEVTTSAGSREMGLVAKVIFGADGEAASLILTSQDVPGLKVEMPGWAFPFVKNGHMVLAVLTVVQVAKAEPKLASRILRPGVN